MPSCLAQEVVSKSAQVTEKKECEALRLHCVTKMVFGVIEKGKQSSMFEEEKMKKIEHNEKKA